MIVASMLELPLEEYRALVAEIARHAQAAAPRPAPGAVASTIESTLLRANATPGDVEQLCAEALRHGFAAVCVQPEMLAAAAAALRGSPVLAVTVVDFPLGAGLGAVKLFQAEQCLKLGADELDVVMNLGAFKAGRDAQVQSELAAIAGLAHGAGARLKVILEMARLEEAEKPRAARLALEAGADFLKTSTGAIPDGGATVGDVALLRSLAPPTVGIKAAGGIRTLAQAQALLAAGANRLGTSHAVQMVNP